MTAPRTKERSKLDLALDELWERSGRLHAVVMGRITELETERDALREALSPYLRQHDLITNDRHCVCSYCNAARAALGAPQ